MIRAVIFDLDNTLYNYDRCNAIAERKLVEQIASSFDITFETSINMLKRAKKNIKDQLGEGVAASHNRLLYMQNICEQLGRNPLLYAVKFYDTYWNSMLNEMELYEYVVPMINALRDNNIQIGILTDLTAHIQYRKLEKLGLANMIDVLVTSEEAGAEKPSDKIFTLMLSKLNVLPNEAVMIGDNQIKDIDGATAVGMKAMKYEQGTEMGEMLIKILRENENEVNSCTTML